MTGRGKSQRSVCARRGEDLERKTYAQARRRKVRSRKKNVRKSSSVVLRVPRSMINVRINLQVAEVGVRFETGPRREI